MVNIKLKDVIDRLADLVEIEVVIDDYGNIAATYDNDMEHIQDYLNCEVETIDTTEDGILILVVDGNTGTEDE